MTVKRTRSITIDPEVLREAIDKAQFYGYRSLSDLAEDLLRIWVKDPVKRNTRRVPAS